MYFLLFLLLLCAMLIYLVYKYPLEVRFVFDSDKMDMHATAFWLKPLIKITAKPADTRLKISLYIFNKKLISRLMTKASGKKRRGRVDQLKALSVQDSRVEIFYGLNEPAVTGVLCGLISSFNSIVGIKELKQYPNFLPYEEYILISANIKINMGKTIANLIMLKSKKSKGEKAWIRQP